MPVITSIKPQKSKKRVNVYLDGKFGFGLDLENFIKFGLKLEQELSEEEIREILKKAEFQKTLDRLLKFAMLRPRSKREVTNWLRRKKVNERLHKDLFNRLKRLDLIDDKRFAEWWVEQRISFRPRGKRALSCELREKGIDREIISQVLEKADIDEMKLARKLIEKKNYRWQSLARLEARQKMSGFLARKGFSWEIIRKVTERELTDEV